MSKTEYIDEIKEIRQIMEKSTKFLSLSGLSGILAGIYALIGAFLAYRITYNADHIIYNDIRTGDLSGDLLKLVLIAGGVFVLALATGIILSIRKANKEGSKIWTKSARRLIFNFTIPLATGGVFILLLYLRGYYGLIAPAALVFYGLALINAGNFTFSDVRYLGIIEIVLGLITGFVPSYGLITWAIGFGVLHIVYGTIMYYKYE
jgi:hypothetical protein